MITTITVLITLFRLTAYASVTIPKGSPILFNYVQGLEIHDGKLYVSSGLYGRSHISRYDFATGALKKQQRLHPAIFAEGLTIFGDMLYQLTWRERLVIVYRRDKLEFDHTFQIPGQGWGLTHDGQRLIYSDGSHYLYFIDPETEQIVDSISVEEKGLPVTRLNELEYVDGKVWANIFQQDRIVIIDPGTGKVEGSIDMSGLLPAIDRLPDTDVLNGIARNPEDGAIWVTGKRWPWLYRIEVLPR